MNIEKALDFFNNLKLNKKELKIANRLIIKIKSRLSFLTNVGLYLFLVEHRRLLEGEAASQDHAGGIAT